MSSYTRTRLTPQKRKLQILNAAMCVSLERGLYNFSIANVSRSLGGCSKATVRHYFSMESLRNAVVEKALIDGQNVTVVQAITMNHAHVSHLTKDQRRKYLKGAE